MAFSESSQIHKTKNLKPREEVAYLRPAPGCWVRSGSLDTEEVGGSVEVEIATEVEEGSYVLDPLLSYSIQFQSPCQEMKAASFPFPK